MTQEVETTRLSYLRAKTDRQVIDFVHSKLDAALVVAGEASSRLAAGDRSAAQQLLGRADAALGEAQKLLLVLDEQPRRSLERKLAETTAALGRLCLNPEMLRPLFFTASTRSAT